jgi:hypothetical protein
MSHLLAGVQFRGLGSRERADTLRVIIGVGQNRHQALGLGLNTKLEKASGCACVDRFVAFESWLFVAWRAAVTFVFAPREFMACTWSCIVVLMLSHGGEPSPKVEAAFFKLVRSWETVSRCSVGSGRK